MGIYTNTSIILGVRILVSEDKKNYVVKHTFIGDEWRECASEFLENYSKTVHYKIQTLHNCTTVFDTTESISSRIWMDNPTFSF